MGYKETILEKVKKFAEDYPDLAGKSESDQFQIFSLFQILREHDIEPEDIVSGVVDGSDDLGIDAIYSFINGRIIGEVDDLERDFGDNWEPCIKIIQIKKENSFSETALIKLKDGLEHTFDFDGVPGDNTKLKNRLEVLRALWDKWRGATNATDIKVEVYYISLGRKKQINSKIPERIEGIVEFLKSVGIKNPQFSLVGSEELYSLLYARKYSKDLEAIDSVDYSSDHSKGVKGYILIVDGNKFFEFIKGDNGKIDDGIFEENVRDYQGDGKQVVKNIKNTVESDEKRSNFWCMNNGVTILASRAVRQKRTKFGLSNYQIINGCQTSYSIYEALSESDGTIENFEIIVRLIETNDDATAIDIIQATNSQVPIETTAIKAQENVHRAIEDFLKSGTNVFYYERRKNFYRRQRVVEISRIIEPKKLFQIIWSVYFQKPNSARRNPTANFDKHHDEVFQESYEFIHYKIACLLFAKVVALSREYKKGSGLSDIEVSVINNGKLHISRILLSLLTNTPRKFAMGDKNSEIVKNSDIYMDKINALAAAKGDLFGKALEVLLGVVNEYKTQLGADTPVTYILKLDTTDDLINEAVNKLLSKP